jgi:hypothetical protein
MNYALSAIISHALIAGRGLFTRARCSAAGRTTTTIALELRAPESSLRTTQERPLRMHNADKPNWPRALFAKQTDYSAGNIMSCSTADLDHAKHYWSAHICLYATQCT